MNSRGVFILAVACLFCVARAIADEPGPDVTKFLKDNGLEKYHAQCVKCLSSLAGGDVDEATRVFVSSAGKTADSNMESQFRAYMLQMAGLLAGHPAEDIELVGNFRISSRSLVLFYVMHVEARPMLVEWTASRDGIDWHTSAWHFTLDRDKQISDLKGITRLAGDTVTAIPRSAPSMNASKSNSPSGPVSK